MAELRGGNGSDFGNLEDYRSSIVQSPSEHDEDLMNRLNDKVYMARIKSNQSPLRIKSQSESPESKKGAT